MSEFEIHEVTIPTSLDVPEAAEFISAIEVGNAVDAIGYGSADLSFGPDEELPMFSNPHQPHRMLVAGVEGSVRRFKVWEATPNPAWGKNKQMLEAAAPSAPPGK